METKEYILTNATQLFNREGATTTSLRQLAAYLDMSDGNLRYHFKNKEELVFSIFMQMIQEMKAANEPETPGADSLLEDVKIQLRAIYFTMYRYKFLYLEANLLFKQYNTFRKAFIDMMKTRRAFFHHYLSTYKKQGLFREEFSNTDFEMLFDQLFILSDNWIKYVELEQTTPASIDKKIDHYIELCLKLLKGALREGVIL